MNTFNKLSQQMMDQIINFFLSLLTSSLERQRGGDSPQESPQPPHTEPHPEDLLGEVSLAAGPSHVAEVPGDRLPLGEATIETLSQAEAGDELQSPDQSQDPLVFLPDLPQQFAQPHIVRVPHVLLSRVNITITI